MNNVIKLNRTEQYYYNLAIGFIQAENCITQGDWGELAMHDYPIYRVLEQITLSDINNPPKG